MGAVLTLDQASRLYHIPLTDYGAWGDDSRGNGLLVSSGCGMMMATMDCVPALRWCVDTDDLRGRKSARIDDFLLVAQYLATPLGVCGWFSISDPAPLRRAVEALSRPVVVYTGNVRLGVVGEVDSFDKFLRALQAASASGAASVEPFGVHPGGTDGTTHEAHD